MTKFHRYVNEEAKKNDLTVEKASAGGYWLIGGHAKVRFWNKKTFATALDLQLELR